MRLKNKNNTPKLKYALIVAALFIVLGGGAIAAYSINTSLNKSQNTTKDGDKNVSPEGIDYGDATDEQKQAGYDQKDAAQTESPTPDPEDPINIVFTALNPPTPDSTVLQVRVRIDMLTSTGSCVLTLVKGSTTITKQAGTQAGPTTSTCKGFDVSSSELSSGNWKATINVVADGREGSVMQTFTVQ